MRPLCRLLRAAFEAEQHAQPRPGILDVFRHVEGRELGLLARTIFERLPVEREAFFFFAGIGGRGRPPSTFLVEAALGFVAQPFALQHLLVEVRQRARCGGLSCPPDFSMLPTTCPRMSSPTRSIVRNVADFGHPTASPVSASTSSMLRSISCISRITLSTENVPMRLAMKLGVSLANTTPLPRFTSLKWATASIAAAVRFRCGDNFQQPHVARRIEKMRAQPRLAEIVGEAFGNLCHGQAAGVGA